MRARKDCSGAEGGVHGAIQAEEGGLEEAEDIEEIINLNGYFKAWNEMWNDYFYGLKINISQGQSVTHISGP